MLSIDYVRERTGLSTRSNGAATLVFGEQARRTPGLLCPWASAIVAADTRPRVYSNTEVIGSITIVSQEILLTALHVFNHDFITVQNRTPYVYLGANSIETDPGEYWELAASIQPGDHQSRELDLAIAQTVQPYPEAGEQLQIANRETVEFAITEKRCCLVVGFGSLIEGGPFSKIKHDVPVRLVNEPSIIPPDLETLFSNHAGPNWTETYICTHSINSGPTNYDSGAPLVCAIGNQVYLLGIEVTGGREPGSEDYFALYVDISKVPYLQP